MTPPVPRRADPDHPHGPAAARAATTGGGAERDRLARILGPITTELRRLGGDELADDAQAEAIRYADLFHPWDGHGEEPPDRLRARLAILRTRLEIARTPTEPSDRPGVGPPRPANRPSNLTDGRS